MSVPFEVGDIIAFYMPENMNLVTQINENVYTTFCILDGKTLTDLNYDENIDMLISSIFRGEL